MSRVVYWLFIALAVAGCFIAFWTVKAASDECTTRGGVLVSAPMKIGVCVVAIVLPPPPNPIEETQ